MKKEIDDLNFKMLKSSLVSLEIEISWIEKDVNFIVYDIEYLERIKGTLVQNKKILKSQKIISMAQSYKKTISDIEVVNSKLKSYYDVLNKKKQSLERLEKQYEELSESIKSVEEYLKNKKVVINFLEEKKKREK